jgi:hypothetical protein
VLLFGRGAVIEGIRGATADNRIVEQTFYRWPRSPRAPSTRYSYGDGELLADGRTPHEETVAGVDLHIECGGGARLLSVRTSRHVHTWPKVEDAYVLQNASIAQRDNPRRET